jgi:hypothetical protein
MGRNLLDVIAGVVWFGFALSHANAQGQRLGGTLELKDFGSFYIHGRVIETQYPNTPATGLSAPGQITVGQMYVQYMIPQRTVTRWSSCTAQITPGRQRCSAGLCATSRIDQCPSH